MNKDHIIAIALIALAGGIFYLSSAKSSENINNSSNSKEESKKEVQLKKEEIADLKIEVLKEGTGEKVTKDGDNISVHYTGTLEDGAKFDSSLDEGTPFTFVLGEGKVIRGWDQGLLGMKIGEKRKLTIPSSLGYGENGRGNVIPPNATLIFETELMTIN